MFHCSACRRQLLAKPSDNCCCSLFSFLFSSGIYFSLVLFQAFRFFKPNKRTQNSFATTRQILDVQKQPAEVFCKKRCSKNFANFTGKHLCWSLFLIKFHAFRLFLISTYLFILIHTYLFILVFRSSRQEVFCKKGVLRNFAKFTGKHLCQSLFFNRCFSVNFAKFLRTTFLTEHLQWLLLLCSLYTII